MSEDQNQAPPPISPLPPSNHPPPPFAPPPMPMPNPDHQARTWNMLCHLTALSIFVGVPFGNIFGPLIIWLLKKNEFPSVDIHGKRALNFQISVTLTLIVLFAAFFILHFICIGWLLVPVLIVLPVVDLIITIIAAVKTSNGEDYKYPYGFEFVK